MSATMTYVVVDVVEGERSESLPCRIIETNLNILYQ